jgi:hypothetical protein
MSEEIIKLRAEESTYGVIHRLGLKYVGRGHARPNFATNSLVARFWNGMFDVFDNFRQLKIDHADARQELLDLVEEYGPRIWGSSRAHIIAHPNPSYPEYTRDLHWSDGLETQELYSFPIQILV